MAKLVLNIYHSRLKDHITNKLSDKNSEQYLFNLNELYSATTRLTGVCYYFRFLNITCF